MHTPLHSDLPDWHRVVGNSYVLMTAAHNEQECIGHTIESVLAQTLLPKRWVIISDNSDDKTDEIIKEYARRHEFIRFHRVTRQPGRNFASKVAALQAGYGHFTDVSFDLIGNVDADVTVHSTYFKDLITHCQEDPRLGLVGGAVYEEENNEFRSRRRNSIDSVAHAAQLVRRECYEGMGGYAILRYGGEDWHAQISVMMRGWRVRSFPEHPIFHHRHTGEGNGNPLPYLFRQGRMDYSFGSFPAFEVIKCSRRLAEKPFLIGGLARLTGFWWSSLCKDDRLVPNDFIDFLQKQQKERVSAMFTRILE
jgi:poly-beta-1,6-N-acetyl-D-glucosamine synthase